MLLWLLCLLVLAASRGSVSLIPAAAGDPLPSCIHLDLLQLRSQLAANSFLGMVGSSPKYFGPALRKDVSRDAVEHTCCAEL